VLALDHDGSAIYNIVDDEPAPIREWLPVLAEALGTKPPRHIPVWLERPIAGEFAVLLTTEARGASNAKAKRELGWTLRYPSWRQGFAAVYGRHSRKSRRSTSRPDGCEEPPAPGSHTQGIESGPGGQPI
jgi:nucleoside-diphosphate-sugar epimerase